MLKVKNLNLNYDNFALKNVSFELPMGYIMGFIGTNGAGKTTTIKSMLNIVTKGSGTVLVNGANMDVEEREIKQTVSLSMGNFDFYPNSILKNITKVCRDFYNNWNEAKYKGYMAKFNLDDNQRVRQLSQGMRVKYSLALALAHDSKLLIFDEPTSGIDPVARAEIQEIFREIVSNGDKSVLFSTHITADLDKCADYVMLIKNGEIILCDTKDNIINSHRLVTGGRDALTKEIKQSAIGYKVNHYNFTALIKSDNVFKGLNAELPNLENITVYYNMENAL